MRIKSYDVVSNDSEIIAVTLVPVLSPTVFGCRAFASAIGIAINYADGSYQVIEEHTVMDDYCLGNYEYYKSKYLGGRKNEYANKYADGK